MPRTEIESQKFVQGKQDFVDFKLKTRAARNYQFLEFKVNSLVIWNNCYAGYIEIIMQQAELIGWESRYS